MRDIDVRKAVHRKILKEHHKDPDTLVIDEFVMNMGSSRADITVINGLMHGYELKSKSDNLLRLPQQVTFYSSIMDKATLVVSECHANQATCLLPEWWGIKVATEGARKAVHLETVRSNKINNDIDKVSLCMLLWKDEMLNALESYGMLRGLKSKPRRYLWNVLAEVASTDELRGLVRQTLKGRTAWRVDQLPL